MPVTEWRFPVTEKRFMAGGFIHRIFWTALIAGGFAGLVLAGIQQFTIVPMILEAETYETGDSDQGHRHEPEEQADGHSHGAWSPEEGMERSVFTFMSTMVVGMGFALLLVACYAIRAMIMESRIHWRWGILWGLGGFAAFHLAPALGIPPELPGAAAAELSGRQGWWLLTVGLTAGGLLCLVFVPGAFRWSGLLLIALPHLTGAPQPETPGGLAPVELARDFLYMSLFTNAIFWIVLGSVTAYLYDRLGVDDTAPA